MNIPNSTYRIQLHKDFNFHHLQRIIDYLHEMGISTVYASPVTTAIKGSQHGYDVTDPGSISKEIGTEDDLAGLAETLKKNKMTWLQDVVPNHMAYDLSNPWLKDVLEKGPSSRFYNFFDIEPLSPQLLDNKLMVPFLGNTLTECIQKGEIKLDVTGDKFVIRYYQQEYPLNERSVEWLSTILPDASPARLIRFFNEHPSLIKELLDLQHYVLTHFHLAASVINYRRFFTVSSLICLRMEDEEVFNTYHRQILSWYEKGYIQGLRVDHIDGLAAPGQYIRRLRESFGKDCYIIAEKILAADEPLPDDWQLQGATGYEFLASAGQLFTDSEGFRQIESFYRTQIASDIPDYNDLVFDRKLWFLQTNMGGELDNLVHRSGVPAEQKAPFKDALARFMSSFPVYRLYPESEIPQADLDGPLSAVPEDQRALLQTALSNPAFLSRVMQFTGPLAAKGIEDTVFYVYDPLIARNEVGDTPSISGIDTTTFHQRMRVRQQHWPHAMNAGTTHDTKRGEDSRIRLCWLSAVPDEWIAAVTRWRQLNHPLIREHNNRPVPTPNDEYFIYQSLLAACPPDLVITGQFRQRFHDMLTKALREAKSVTKWDNPDESYEKYCHSFLDAVLDPTSPFMEDFVPFAYECIRDSAHYSLSQVLLRLTAPGVPDIYQGAESWDLSFVDPDNRRPVDYALRRQLLSDLKAKEQEGATALFDYIRANQRKGAGKLYSIYKTLQYRNTQPDVFTKGEYIPVDLGEHHLAYIRRHDSQWALVILPLIRMTAEISKPFSITLPGEAPSIWTNVFTGETFQTSSGRLDHMSPLEKYPIALLSGNVSL